MNDAENAPRRNVADPIYKAFNAAAEGTLSVHAGTEPRAARVHRQISALRRAGCNAIP